MKTTATPFYPCTPGRLPLFTVAAGVPVAAALEQAYCLLDVAEELAAGLSDPGTHNAEQVGHACHALVQMAKAAVGACTAAMEKGCHHE